MAFPSDTQLTTLLEPLVRQYGLVIEDIQVAKAGAKSSVKIFVDSASVVPTTLASAPAVTPDEFTGPDLDAVEELSRDISEQFDQAEDRGEVNFGPGYTLEVGSAGASAPITQPRHWVKNIGRQVTLPEGEKARVLQAADDGVILAIRKGKHLRVSRYTLDEVSGARVEIEFSKVPEAEQHLVGLQASAYDAMIERR
ncbi:ribosome maturation factor RimP [Corynebacterium auriscanis]|uniref:ribosome maturation factor RimP n=1 Tax=Corynebacterium auriscanis TaxID=99807 RepID=UPI00224656F0|nr:ribosome maturation factor RimP [Corynebacterium auriscanis]MCX2163022.1 ribosome maturation factor RimP [Corynebacterium auriscanis]